MITVIERRSLKVRRGPDQVTRFVQKRRQSVRRLNVYDVVKIWAFRFTFLRLRSVYIFSLTGA
jgi:hypothetical protein